MARRNTEEAVFKCLMWAAMLSIFGVLLFIMAVIIAKGLPAINLAMVTQPPKGGFYLGKEGGILNAIIGSLVLAGGATLLAGVVSLPVVLYLTVYTKKGSWLAAGTRFAMDVMWGIPSIVYGAFGFTLMGIFGLRASLLGGIIAVALLILPVMTRAIDEVMRMIPAELLEASYALGATQYETACKVVVRQTLPGILTAVLIAFGRGIGDAAAVIFTAGFSDSMSVSLLRPVATLPLAIFFQLGTPVPEVRERAYASAFILTVLILAVSVVCRFLTRRYGRNVVK